MAERARDRAARTRPALPVRRNDDPTRRAPQPWLNGWSRINDGRTVLLGTVVCCVCCGREQGITCVVFPADWEPPPTPVWPFGRDDCPLCD